LERRAETERRRKAAAETADALREAAEAEAQVPIVHSPPRSWSPADFGSTPAAREAVATTVATTVAETAAERVAVAKVAAAMEAAAAKAHVPIVHAPPRSWEPSASPERIACLREHHLLRADAVGDRHGGDKVDEAGRVAPLVGVPREKLDDFCSTPGFGSPCSSGASDGIGERGLPLEARAAAKEVVETEAAARAAAATEAAVKAAAETEAETEAAQPLARSPLPRPAADSDSDPIPNPPPRRRDEAEESDEDDFGTYSYSRGFSGQAFLHGKEEEEEEGEEAVCKVAVEA